MRDFVKHNRSGGRRDFGERREPREMFDAICDNCGKACKLPFRPTEGKPVYCSDCYEKMQEQNGDRPQQRFGRPQFNRPFQPRESFRPRERESFQPRESFPRASKPAPVELDAINAKLDTILRLLTAKNETKQSNPVEKSPEVITEAKETKPKKKITKEISEAVE